MWCVVCGVLQEQALADISLVSSFCHLQRLDLSSNRLTGELRIHSYSCTFIMLYIQNIVCMLQSKGALPLYIYIVDCIGHSF